jgi:hypothetical protein
MPDERRYREALILIARIHGLVFRAEVGERETTIEGWIADFQSRLSAPDRILFDQLLYAQRSERHHEPTP